MLGITGPEALAVNLAAGPLGEHMGSFIFMARVLTPKSPSLSICWLDKCLLPSLGYLCVVKCLCSSDGGGVPPKNK